MTTPIDPIAAPQPAQAPARADAQPTADPVPALVAKVFEEAPPTVRGRLLEQLLEPLGLLSLVAVANGIFARITAGQGWQRLSVSPEDVSRVHARDVVALVLHVQQVSVQAIDGVARIIAASPVLAGSATAAMLLTVLATQAQNRTYSADADLDPNLDPIA